MSYLSVKSKNPGKRYHYKLLPLGDFSARCIKITDIDSDKISFRDNMGNSRFIIAGYIPFWGRDIYTEVLCDLYGGSGLLINNSRSKEYYEEAKSYLRETDFIKFCNLHKTRWSKLTNINYNATGFT